MRLAVPLTLSIVLVCACFAIGQTTGEESARVRLIPHEPVVVSRAPDGVKPWGPWQFPALSRMPDGRLALGYHVEDDSATAYGKPRGLALSDDDGQTWRDADQRKDAPSWATRIIVLPNGDQLRQIPMRSLDPAPLRDSLPPAIHEAVGGYGHAITMFDANAFPPDLAGYRFARRTPGHAGWVEENATVNVPGALRLIYMDVLVMPWFYRIAQAPDGSLWGIKHARRYVGGSVLKHTAALFVRSVDGGRTWNFLSEIPYSPDAAEDPFAEEREGFTEANIAFLPDTSLLCLMRTTDGKGIGPLYRSRSTDNGQSWSNPEVFDDCGVWPSLVTLENGVTLASYGRPGLFVRATRDPAGAQWDDRIAVVEPGGAQRDTCSYSALLPLTSTEALIAYSDFQFPDEQGRPRKTILVRRIEVR